MTSRFLFNRILTFLLGPLGGLCCLIAAIPSWADEGLYDNIPKGSAFVRIINNTDSAVVFNSSAKTAGLTVAGRSISGYWFFKGGHEYRFNISGMTASKTLSEKQVYTILYDGNSIQWLEGKFFESKRKAFVSFYNFTGKALSLKTQSGKHTVVEGVNPTAHGYREVNELKIALSAFAETGLVANFDEQFLRKGRSYTYLIFTDRSGNLVTKINQDFVDHTE